MVGLAGTSVRLRSDTGGEQVVLAGHLMAAPDLALPDGGAAPPVEPFGLLAEAVAETERWRDHILEAETSSLPSAAATTRRRHHWLSGSARRLPS